MKASIAFILFCAVGGTFGYYLQREAPYNVGPNDPFAVDVTRNFFQEPSERLFWGNTGSNQVGGTGFWATLTNKFPFLGNMFGRMEEPSTQYGPPATYYGPPAYQRPQFYQPHQQFLPQQQFVRQPFFSPQINGIRDFGLTDDAVIITPPQVPAFPPRPPASAPAPAPEPTPGSGYSYNKPQYRLELPQK